MDEIKVRRSRHTLGKPYEMVLNPNANTSYVWNVNKTELQALHAHLTDILPVLPDEEN